MTDAPDSLELQLGDDIGKFYADPLGFVKYVYPWGQPGLLEQHNGPDDWQQDFLIELGRQVQDAILTAFIPWRRSACAL